MLGCSNSLDGCSFGLSCCDCVPGFEAAAFGVSVGVALVGLLDEDEILEPFDSDGASLGEVSDTYSDGLSSEARSS